MQIISRVHFRKDEAADSFRRDLRDNLNEYATFEEEAVVTIWDISSKKKGVLISFTRTATRSRGGRSPR
jgi:hypothetical protein